MRRYKQTLHNDYSAKVLIDELDLCKKDFEGYDSIENWEENHSLNANLLMENRTSTSVLLMMYKLQDQ